MARLTDNYGRRDRRQSPRSVAVPLEYQPFVDADGVKAHQISFQFLEMVAWRHPQVPIRRRVVDHLDSTEQAGFQVGRNFL
jgi:hypothetical protein